MAKEYFCDLRFFFVIMACCYGLRVPDMNITKANVKENRGGNLFAFFVRMVIGCNSLGGKTTLVVPDLIDRTAPLSPDQEPLIWTDPITIRLICF